MEGLVFVDGQRSDKAGTKIRSDAAVEVRGEECPFVSRGGKKLAKAVESFDISLDGLVCADIGASTGGFTDCMLQNGAAKVYSVDVGYGQLAWKLRSDSRVVCIERTNARYLNAEIIPEPLDFASADVSFISLSLILPAVSPLLKQGAHGVFLVKPQFEAGRDKVGKNGVVRDPSVHIDVIKKVITYVENNGLSVLGLDYSPIKGPKGNIEYLIYVGKGISPVDVNPEAVVKSAHENLNSTEQRELQ